MNNDYNNFHEHVARIQLFLFLQFWYKWPLSAHAQILSANWFIVQTLLKGDI